MKDLTAHIQNVASLSAEMQKHGFHGLKTSTIDQHLGIIYLTGYKEFNGDWMAQLSFRINENNLVNVVVLLIGAGGSWTDEEIAEITYCYYKDDLSDLLNNMFNTLLSKTSNTTIPMLEKSIANVYAKLESGEIVDGVKKQMMVRTQEDYRAIIKSFNSIKSLN